MSYAAQPVAAPPITIDHETAVTTAPFPFAQFLSSLRGGSGDKTTPKVCVCVRALALSITAAVWRGCGGLRYGGGVMMVLCGAVAGI